MKNDNFTTKDNSISKNNTEISEINTSNPFETRRIMPLNSKSSANKLYGGWANPLSRNSNIDYIETINAIISDFQSIRDASKLFYEVHSSLSKKINLNFSAVGICNNTSNCVDFQLINKNKMTYNQKVLLSDLQNPVIQSITKRTPISTINNNYLKIDFLPNSSTHIIPLIAFADVFGVLVFSDDSLNQNLELYKLISTYYAISYSHKILSDLVDRNTDTDTLTGLNNHKKLQESLSREIATAQKYSSNLAFCIIDISNISGINADLGHAKGDLVIKEVAKRIRKNVRNTDIIGRYGGDEIGIIMPDTSETEAKYVCEFLLYNLACTMFDDLGQLKFSCGISFYPTSTTKQEKLTVLAEQALYMAKGKIIKSGQSEIISTSDYNFWEDEALKSFAEIISKKHATNGINIEEELLLQFHGENIISNDHLLEVVSSLAGAIDAKDTYTKGHSSSVSRYSEALARAINLPLQEVERIKLGAMLHDVGKIGIPENILRKPTKLSDDEWKIMKQHPQIGAEKVLEPNPSLHDLIPMVKYHHEHVDGSGYPYGLKGDDIPKSARIVAIADAFHALISDRPYRKGLSVAKACEILKEGAGIYWDKELIREFIIIAPSLATNI